MKVCADRKFIVILIGMILLITLTTTAVAFPTLRGISAARSGIVAATEEFTFVQQSASAVQEYRTTEIHAMQKLREHYDARLPVGEELPQLLAVVREACKNAGVADVAIITRSPESLRNHEGLGELLFHRVPVTVSGECDYRTLGAVLENLGVAERMIVVREVVLQRSALAGSAVLFRIEADAFCLLPPVRPGAGR